jgi:predicted kinase
MTKNVFIFFGMVATGKSYLASAWGRRYGCLYLNSDIVRKKLAGIAPENEQKLAINEGIYSPDFTRRTYDELIACTERALGDERTPCIVLDASYHLRSERERLCGRLEKRCRLLFFHCVCPEEIVKKRLALRAADPGAVSDGRWEVFKQQKKSFVLPTEQPSDRLMTVATDQPLAELIVMVERNLVEMGVSLRSRPS